MVIKILKWFGIVLGSIVVAFLAFVYFANYHPAELESEAVVCPANAPALKKGQHVKILNWNIQYMAGKNYTFFYDVLDGSGKDTRPSPEDIAITIKEVARIINEEKPDILNIQELDEGSKRTDYADQLQLLLKQIPPEYSCYSDAFYHKSAFVPHPSILGAVGMKLATISKFKMTKATRHQLALIPSNFVTQQFNLKRAVLEVQMPVEGDKDLLVLNTHLDAFSQGTNTMEMQVAEVKEILEKATTDGNPWIMSGDFNLLPPGAYELIREDERAYYKPDTELAGLYKEFHTIPSIDDTKPQNPNRSKWFTHFPNGNRATGPDRTIDYVFYSPRVKLGPYSIRSTDTLKISDHLPFRAEFNLP